MRPTRPQRSHRGCAHRGTLPAVDPAEEETMAKAYSDEQLAKRVFTIVIAGVAMEIVAMLVIGL